MDVCKSAGYRIVDSLSSTLITYQECGSFNLHTVPGCFTPDCSFAFCLVATMYAAHDISIYLYIKCSCRRPMYSAQSRPCIIWATNSCLWCTDM